MTSTKKALTYASRLRAQLAGFKRDVLGVVEDGIWNANGKAYPHILPVGQKWLNIDSSFRTSLQYYLENTLPSIKLHRDFHHLNSSQAMAFNLFYPWFSAGCGANLIEALELTPLEASDWKFEHILDSDEMTNLDFWIKFAGNEELHVEVKLTENEFGKALNDNAHRQKMNATYRPRLEGKIDVSVADETLFKHYQLMRIVSGLDIKRGDHAIVIAPKDNTPLLEQFSEFHSLLSAEARARLTLLSLERVCENLGAKESCNAVADIALLHFKEKYLLRPTDR